MKDENECMCVWPRGCSKCVHACMVAYCASVLFLAGFCDFEMDFCGWVNNPKAESGVDWDWLSGGSEGSLIPKRDHSTNSALGKSPQTYVHTNIGIIMTVVFCNS